MPRDAATVYVGNLPWESTEDDLASLFGEFVRVRVVDARVIQDPATGRSRGYGFVELSDPKDVPGVIAALNGRELDGRALIVGLARPKPPRH